MNDPQSSSNRANEKVLPIHWPLTLIEYGNDLISLINQQYRCIYLNGFGKSLLGYEGNAWTDCSVFEMIHPDDISKLRHTLEILQRENGSKTVLELRFCRYDGEWSILETKIINLLQEPNVAAFAVVGFDITERKKTENELLRIRGALDDCDSAVLIVDRYIQASYFNAAFGNIFGYTLETGKDIKIESLFDDPEAAQSLLNAARVGDSWIGEVPMIARDGRRFPAALRVTVVLDEEMEVEGALFILNDITERKQMESQLIQSQKLKAIGQLAAGIAHEINTPTQYVSDNTRFLSDSFSELMALVDVYRRVIDGAKSTLPLEALNSLTEAEAKADLDYLRAEVPLAIGQSIEGLERVTEIVRAMRQFTHPGSQAKVLVDLDQAIDCTLTVARNEWKYVADLERITEPGLPLVPCYPGDLNQVMLNLIVNAADAIREAINANEKGRITVATRRDDDWVEVRVGDTGKGIAEDIRDRIFEPFFTTKEVGKGTGQGLAISHSVIVEKHGGAITFETEAGQGTTFILRLPLHSEEWMTGEEHRGGSENDTHDVG